MDSSTKSKHGHGTLPSSSTTSMVYNNKSGGRVGAHKIWWCWMMFLLICSSTLIGPSTSIGTGTGGSSFLQPCEYIPGAKNKQSDCLSNSYLVCSKTVSLNSNPDDGPGQDQQDKDENDTDGICKCPETMSWVKKKKQCRIVPGGACIDHTKDHGNRIDDNDDDLEAEVRRSIPDGLCMDGYTCRPTPDIVAGTPMTFCQEVVVPTGEDKKIGTHKKVEWAKPMGRGFLPRAMPSDGSEKSSGASSDKTEAKSELKSSTSGTTNTNSTTTTSSPTSKSGPSSIYVKSTTTLVVSTMIIVGTLTACLSTYLYL